MDTYGKVYSVKSLHTVFWTKKFTPNSLFEIGEVHYMYPSVVMNVSLVQRKSLEQFQVEGTMNSTDRQIARRDLYNTLLYLI